MHTPHEIASRRANIIFSTIKCFYFEWTFNTLTCLMPILESLSEYISVSQFPACSPFYFECILCPPPPLSLSLSRSDSLERCWDCLRKNARNKTAYSMLKFEETRVKVNKSCNAKHVHFVGHLFTALATYFSGNFVAFAIHPLKVSGPPKRPAAINGWCKRWL